MKRRIICLAVLLTISQSFYGQKLVLSGKVDNDISAFDLKVFNGESLDYEVLKKIKVAKGNYEVTLELDTQNLLLLDFGMEEITLSYTNETAFKVDYVNGKFKIEGSDESLQIQKMNEENGKLQTKHFAQLKKDADAVMASGDKAAMADIQKRSAAAIQNFLPELREWIISKGDGPLGYMAIQYSDFNKELAFIEQRLKAFQKANPESQVTKALELQVYRSKVLSAGKVPPAFEGVDREGKPFSYADYEGKVLLVDFWAAWCRACRIENPQFATLYSIHKEDGLEILSISQDEKEKVWQKAIKKDGIGMWRHIRDKGGVISSLYGVSSLPQNLVIGKDGKILAKNVTADQLEVILKKSL